MKKRAVAHKLSNGVITSAPFGLDPKFALVGEYDAERAVNDVLSGKQDSFDIMAYKKFAEKAAMRPGDLVTVPVIHGGKNWSYSLSDGEFAYSVSLVSMFPTVESYIESQRAIRIREINGRSVDVEVLMWSQSEVGARAAMAAFPGHKNLAVEAVNNGDRA